MGDSIEKTLQLIEVEQTSVGEGVEPPVGSGELAALKQYARERFGAEPATGYLAFLERSNGMGFNGTVIYGASARHGGDNDRSLTFERSNDIFHEGGNEDYVLYGETGDELFAHRISANTWHILDRGSLSPVETYPSFDLLLSRVLSRAYET